MNKAIQMGRLTRDPETRVTQSENPITITRYTLAVRRQYAKEGQPDVDFINIVAFGKAGEFAAKHFVKGMQITIVGRIQTGSFDDKDGVRRYTTEIIVEEQHFTESKRAFEASQASKASQQTQTNTENQSAEGFVPIKADTDDDDLPF